jgi:hypothetical protein
MFLVAYRNHEQKELNEITKLINTTISILKHPASGWYTVGMVYYEKK